MKPWLVAALPLCLGTACSEPLQLEWTHELGAASLSTPVVTQDFIALGHANGLDILDREGKKRCTFETQSDVISAPKTDGERIYFGSTNFVFYAIDRNCTLQWKYLTGDRIKSDPLLHEGKVYTSSYDGHVYALDAKTGEPVWTFPRKNTFAAVQKVNPEPATPTPELELIAFAELEGSAIKAGDFSYSSPTIHDDTLYVGNMDHYVYALDAKVGHLKWRYRTNAPVTSSPLYHDKMLYFGSNDGHVYAVDVSRKRLLWKLKTVDWVNSSPRVVGDSLYIGANDGHVYAIERFSGRIRWKYRTNGPVVAIPAIYKNLVVAAGGQGDGSIYVIDDQNHALLWRYRTGDKIDSDPVLKGSHLYVSGADGKLYCFRIRPNRA